jgi:aspartate carbamoyltransferase catalytic subunit
MTTSFRHLVSASQVTRQDADFLISEAQGIIQRTKERERISRLDGLRDRFHDMCVASLFYESSTRTQVSFDRALRNLGSEVMTAQGFQFSSLYKGESVADNTRVIAAYDMDAIIMRHPHAGSATEAMDALEEYRHETGRHVPFVNAGDGENEHPSQALLDILTIQEECKTLAGRHIAMIGDLKFGRTVHSLAKLMTLYPDTRFTFAAPNLLRMPEHVKDLVSSKGALYEEVPTLEDALSKEPDVVYMTRVQKERFKTPDELAEYERVKGDFILHPELLAQRAPVIMHPLPRNAELPKSIDAFPNAAYFRQASNGLPMRMALMNAIMGVERQEGEHDEWYERRTAGVVTETA